MEVTRYKTIVADPPWDHSEGTHVTYRDGVRNVVELPYATMDLDAIKSLKVRDLADNLDGDAFLYLWTTSRYLNDAFDVASAWGFHYSATLVWCKTPFGWSTGGTYQNNVEFVLFCRKPKVVSRPDVLRVTTYLADAAESARVSRADVDTALGTSDMGGWWLSRIEYRCACPSWDQYEQIKRLVRAGDEMDALVREINARKGTSVLRTPQGEVTRWFQWPRGEHSAKPEAFMDMVERVSPGPYLEMFSRRARLGWDVWGNESLGHVEIAA